MRTRALTLLLLTGCVDVEHGLVRTDDGAVAYRLRLTPTEPVPDAVASLADLLPTVAPGEIRTWKDAERWVLQARFDNADSYSTFVERATALVTPVTGPLPPALRPPTVRVDGQTWRVTADATDPPGTWSLTLDGPQVRGDGGRRIPGGSVRWQADPRTPARVDAEILASAAPSFADFLVRGGPSLAAALAGLGLLVWVNRRTRRKLLASAR